MISGHFSLALLLAGVGLWSLPCVTWAQVDGCNLNHVPGSCPGTPDAIANCGCDWFEDFESALYNDDVNDFIDAGDNDWYGWDNDSASRGKIANSIERSDHTSGTGRSLRAIGTLPGPRTDAVHWFRGRDPVDGLVFLGDGAGYDADVSTYWVLEGWVFLPVGHTGNSFVILMNTYDRGAAFPVNPVHEWGVQLRFDSSTGKAIEDIAPGTFVNLVYDQWVKFEARINLATDSVSVYYNDLLVAAHTWLGDAPAPQSDYNVIQAVDLFVDDGTTTYYDDLVLRAANPSEAPTITEIIDPTGDGAGNPLGNPYGIASDGSGNVYVSGDATNNAFKITPGGVITEIIDATGDGAGNTLLGADGIAADEAGNVYVAGSVSWNAFKITPGGTITEIINGTENSLLYPFGIAVDGLANVYVAGNDSHNVFKITPGGMITEIIDAAGDGQGNTLSFAIAVAADAAGNVYVCGTFSDNAFKITPGGVITEIIDPTGDGTNVLDWPAGIAVDGAGNVYVTGRLSDNAFKITPGGVITEIIDANGDGAGNTLADPWGIAVDGAGNVYVAGNISDNAFKITPGGVITEIIDAAGSGPGNMLNAASAIAVDGAGDVYVTGANSNNAFVITFNCGDGLLGPGEPCDDGNNANGDGCAAYCLIEPGNVCTGEPSLCGPDCNANAVLDALDIANETSDDCNGNGVPDECEGPSNDCNNNAIPDVCDIAGPASDDCNGNAVPDECDISDLTSLDCDSPNWAANSVPDECDIANCPPADPDCDDCNANGVPDACDIASAFSDDINPADGRPDECQLGNNDGSWSSTATWDPPVVPNNDMVDTYSVTIDESRTIAVDIEVSIDSLRLLTGATLNVSLPGPVPNDADLGRNAIRSRRTRSSATLRSAGDLTIVTDRDLRNQGTIYVTDARQFQAVGAIKQFCNYVFGRQIARGGCTPPALIVGGGGSVSAAGMMIADARIPPWPDGGVLVSGPAVSPANVEVTGEFRLDRAGLYAEDPGVVGTTDASLVAGSVVISDELVRDELDPGGQMTLTDSMRVSTSGDFRLAGTRSCSGLLVRGGCTPPGLTVSGSASLSVGGNFVVSGDVLLNLGSGAPSPPARSAESAGTSAPTLTLGGNFVNELTNQASFNMSGAWVLLNGVSQTFEVAGFDFGMALEGFTGNYEIGTLEVASTATVTFTDQFDSSPGIEALYVDLLILRAGSVVIFDHVHVYYASLVDEGGTIILLGDGALTQGSCVNDSQCDDGSVCTRDECVDTFCTNTPNKYGDIDGNGFITLADLFCVLDGFAGDFANCSFVQDDIHGSCGGGPNCCPNGSIGLADLFAVLDAFGGEDPCCGG